VRRRGQRGTRRRALRRGNWKLVVHRGSGERELYDLASDPQERVNLAASQPERVAALARELEAALATERQGPVLPQLGQAERAQLQALGYMRE
jgi:arylsulfatase A-like enzyme